MEAPVYKPALGPTPAATTFYREIAVYAKENGFRAYNFGQGAEIDKPGGLIADIWAEPVGFTTSPAYPASVGGAPHVRAAAAGWMTRFLNVPATMDNTFVFATQGRASLDLCFRIFGREAFDLGAKESVVIMDETHWPMLDEQMRDHHLTPDFDVHGLFKEKSNAVCKYTNKPKNPDGTQATNSQMKYERDKLEDVNGHRQGLADMGDAIGGRKVRWMVDSPYFMSCRQRLEPGKSYLDAGFDGVFSANMRTPWYINVSASKAYGLATPGVHIGVVHPAYAGNFSKFANRSYGNAMLPEFGDKFARVIAPENDELALLHFGDLRRKYKTNRDSLVTAFGDKVLPGKPNMTALMTLPKDDLCKRVTGSRTGQEYDIRKLSDFIQYCGVEKGVVFVDNGVDDKGNVLARIAMASRPDDFRDGVREFAAAYEEVRTAKPAFA